MSLIHQIKYSKNFMFFFLFSAFLICTMILFSCSDNQIENKENNISLENNQDSGSSVENDTITLSQPGSPDYDVQEPSNYFDYMDKFQSVLGKIVFVKKDLYGGDLEYNCTLKGRLKNITNEPIKDIFIIWNIWNENDELIEISPTSYYNPPPVFWADNIEYLDSKSEIDFSISMSFGKMTPSDGDSIRESIFNDRYEVCLFILKNKG